MLASNRVACSMLPVKSSSNPMPTDAVVSAKNSITHTTPMLTNAVFTLLAIWRTVNMRMPLR